MMRFAIRRAQNSGQSRNWGVAAALAVTLALSACTSHAIPPLTFGRDGHGGRKAESLANIHVAFAPITGAPANTLDQLSKAIATEAAKRKINLVPSTDPNAGYIVQGYLSAVGGQSGSILVFVWDVQDKAGNRLTRVSGQESSSSGAADPWAGIAENTLTLVAQRTVDGIAAWLSRR